NLRRRHVAALDQRLVAARARLARRSGFTRFVGFVCVNCIARVAMHARGLVTDHGFDRVREDHFAFAAPAVDGAAEFFFAHFTFHIICASKENNADHMPRLNHSYYLDRRPKRPAADRGLKSTDRPLQISAARPAGDQFHERSAVRQHQCVGPNDKSSTSERESDGRDGDRQRHHQQVERHADSHEVAESIAADAVDHQMHLSRTARRCRGWRARSTEQQLVTTIAPAAIHAACIIVTRVNGSSAATMAIAARRPMATEPRSRRGGAERKKTAKLPASRGLVFRTRHSTCRGQRRHSTNSPWAGDLSILNKDGDAATEVQRLARASDDGNRWRTELPHDLRKGCPDWGQARQKSPLSRNENLSRKEARKD